MNMGFSSVGNGGSSSSFSNLSHLAPPFTLDRSVTRPFSNPLVDMTEPSSVVPLNSTTAATIHNWLPSTSKTSGLDFFSNSTPEFDWLSFSTGSKYPRSQSTMGPSDNHGPLLGSLTMSSTDPSLFGNTSDGLTTGIGQEKPYYPSYASTSCNKGGPMIIVDQPTYDYPSNSHVVTFNVPPYTDFSHGSSPSGFERSVEEASHSIHMFDLNKCNDFVRECPSEELLSEQNVNIEQPKNLRMSNTNAHYAFSGCLPKTKTRTTPSNPASSFQNSQYLQKAPYQKILREEDARLSVPTSIANSPNTLSIRTPVLGTDSFIWNIGPCHISGNGDHFFEGKQGGDHLRNLKKSFPVNSDCQEFFSTENHGTCIDKHDPIIHVLQNNVHYAEDSPDHTLKVGMGLHVPDASPQFSLDLKTIETGTTIESSSESFDQYNLAVVDSPCWKGAPISGFSPFQAFEISTPSHVKTVEVNNDVKLSLSQVPPSSAEDSMEVSVHEPNESTIGSVLEKGATSSAKMPSIADSSFVATQKTRDSMKAGESYSEMGCFHPTTGCIHEPVEDGDDFYSSISTPQSIYKNNLLSGKKIAPTSYTKNLADARLNSDDSENSLNHLSCDVAKHVQNLPFELVKVFLGESNSKIDIRILVDTLHSLSELLLVCHSNGLAALHQKDVKPLETVINNIDVCLKSVGSQGSLSPEQRTSQNLEHFHQLHSDVGILKSQSQMTKIEGENLECQSNDGNVVDKTNQYILSVKKDNEAADSLYLRNRIDSVKEDSMTKALKKAMSENFHDDEEHPQTLLYKNLWLEAEAALCASNLRARFNSARSEMEKHESPKVREQAENCDEAFISDASPGSNTIGKLASKTEVGSTSFVSFQTSPTVSVSSHADDVITRFHILKCREDAARHKDARNSVLPMPNDFEVSVKQDVAEKLGLDKKQTAVTCIKDIDSSFPTSELKGNDSGNALPSISPTSTGSSHIDDIMSRFQILKSRSEHTSSLDVGMVQKNTNSHCREIDVLAHKGDPVHSVGISAMNHAIAEKKHDVDNLDASVLERQDVLRRRGNNISLIPAGEQVLEVEVEHLYPESKRMHWPFDENKVKKGGLGVEIEHFKRCEAGNGSRSHIEGKGPADSSDGSSSADWEHVLWCE